MSQPSKTKLLPRVTLLRKRLLGTCCPSHRTFRLIEVLSDLPDKFRFIIDLSSAAGASVNDGIDSELTSLTYFFAANRD